MFCKAYLIVLDMNNIREYKDQVFGLMTTKKEDWICIFPVVYINALNL